MAVLPSNTHLPCQPHSPSHQLGQRQAALLCKSCHHPLSRSLHTGEKMQVMFVFMSVLLPSSDISTKKADEAP